MKYLFSFLFVIILFSCSKDDDSQTPSPTSLTEKITGVWRQTKATYTHIDGSTSTQTEGCSLKNEVGFSSNGAYRADDYEGGDINDCSYSLFEGSWRAETDPENPNANIKFKNDKQDGQTYDDDWDYAKVEFFGNDKMTLAVKFSDGSTSIYEHIKIQ